ncbi:MAG: ArnT family glycosyltransferase [Gemmatimonadaceae bacterium]
MSAILIADSQIFAYVGDESFHLLAAKLVSAGRIPYENFFYQHPPLFIYIIGGIFRVTGASWRAAHAFSALALSGAIILASLYARDLFQEETLRWRNATIVAILVGFNCYALVFGVTGFPQGFCILCLMAALYSSRSKTDAGLVFAGMFAGCAVESSFLAVPALAVFVIWFALKDKSRAFLFVAGAAIAFIPLLILLIVAPDQTFADVFRYHLFDRPKLSWRYNVREIIAWFGSLQGVVLTALAIAAVSLRKDDDVRLCGWISLAMIVTVSLARTTSAGYFLPATPFVAILAATGLIELTQQTNKFARRMVVPVVAVYLVGLVGLRYVSRSETFYFDHRLVEKISQKMDRCSSTARMNAPESIYFAARTLPARGFENRFDPFSKVTQDLNAGPLDAIIIDSYDPRIAQFNLSSRYARREAVPLDGDSIIVFCDRI